MKKKYLTTTEYAAMREPPVTIQAVTKMIRDTGKLPNIKRIEKVGRFYLLYP